MTLSDSLRLWYYLLLLTNYRKQLSDPSSYDLKNIEMNGYSMNKGYMELDKGASGSSAGGDNNV